MCDTISLQSLKRERKRQREGKTENKEREKM
jgi:hypothetical protein